MNMVKAIEEITESRLSHIEKAIRALGITEEDAGCGCEIAEFLTDDYCNGVPQPLRPLYLKLCARHQEILAPLTIVKIAAPMADYVEAFIPTRPQSASRDL